MALFGNTSSSSGGSSKHLAEFRAGKMYLKGTTVTPDKRKGLLFVYQADDSLIHFCWKDRTSGKVEDDLIIFPDDCELKRVPQCTTGRVYILRFKSTNRKLFFWMQEPKSDKDEEHCKKVNDSLNNPPKPGQSSSAGVPDLSGLDSLGQGNLQELFSNVDHQQLLQMMAAGGGLNNLLSPMRMSSRQSRNQSTTPANNASQPATPAPPSIAASAATPTTGAAVTTPGSQQSAAAAAGVQLSQLQDILSQMGVQAPDQNPPLNLADAITPDAMIPILSNPKVQERLKPFLPQGETLNSTEEELRATARSPHFRQAMASFSAALASGQLGPLLAQFGLPAAAQEAASKGDVEGFAKAMQEDAKKNEKAKEDENMSVD